MIDYLGFVRTQRYPCWNSGVVVVVVVVVAFKLVCITNILTSK